MADGFYRKEAFEDPFTLRKKGKKKKAQYLFDQGFTNLNKVRNMVEQYDNRIFESVMNSIIQTKMKNPSINISEDKLRLLAFFHQPDSNTNYRANKGNQLEKGFRAHIAQIQEGEKKGFEDLRQRIIEHYAAQGDIDFLRILRNSLAAKVGHYGEDSEIIQQLNEILGDTPQQKSNDFSQVKEQIEQAYLSQPQQETPEPSAPQQQQQQTPEPTAPSQEQEQEFATAQQEASAPQQQQQSTLPFPNSDANINSENMPANANLAHKVLNNEATLDETAKRRLADEFMVSLEQQGYISGDKKNQIREMIRNNEYEAVYTSLLNTALQKTQTPSPQQQTAQATQEETQTPQPTISRVQRQLFENQEQAPFEMTPGNQRGTSLPFPNYPNDFPLIQSSAAQISSTGLVPTTANFMYNLKEGRLTGPGRRAELGGVTREALTNLNANYGPFESTQLEKISSINTAASQGDASTTYEKFIDLLTDLNYF